MRSSAFVLWKSEVRIAWKQIVRNLLLMAAVVLSLVYCTYSFFSYTGYGDPFVLVYRTRYTQFVVHLLAMIIGLQIGGADANAHFEEISAGITRRWKPKTCASVTTVLCAVGVYFLFYAAAFLVCIIRITNDVLIIRHCLNYLFLYVCLPSATMGLIGANVSLQSSSNLKYVAAFLLWLFFSPVICVAGKYLFTFLQIGGGKLDYLIHILNQGDMIYRDNPSSYTLHTESARYCVRMIFLCAAAISFVFVSSVRKKGKTRRMIGAVSLALSVFVILVSDTPVLNRYFTQYTLNSPAYAQSEDADYYWKISRPDMNPDFDRTDALPEYSAAGDLREVASDITITLKSLGADLHIVNIYCVEGNCTEQSFTLHRNFTVHTVFVNGQAAPYSRSGDYLNVLFPEEFSVGEEVEIAFSYSGLSSAAFPAAKEMVSLSSGYAYLPQTGCITAGEKTPLGMGGYEALPVYCAAQHGNEVEYTLHLDTPYPVYCNLEKTGKGEWAGKTENGVSIVVSPLLREISCDGYTVYTSELVADRAEDIVEMYKASDDIRKSYREFLEPDADLRNIKTMVLLPTSPGVIGIAPYYDMGDFIAVYQGSRAEMDMRLDGWKRTLAQDDLRILQDSYYTQILTEWNEHASLCAAKSCDFMNEYIMGSLQDWYRCVYIDGIVSVRDPFSLSGIEYLAGYYSSCGYDMTAHEQAAGRLEKLFGREDKSGMLRFYKEWYEACERGEKMDIEHICDILDRVSEGT